MAGPVSPIRFPTAANLTAAAFRPAGMSSGFGAVMKDAVDRVESFHREAGSQVEQLLGGESEDLHGAILATQRADLAFELFTQVRNKVVQAYQEVMRMQV